MTETIVAFGRDRTAKEFAHIPYEEGKIFIAVDGDKGAARDDLFACIAGREVVVAILSNADLGRGRGVTKFYDEVARRGSKVRLYEPNKATLRKQEGHVSKPRLTSEQETEVCMIWDKSYMREADRLAQIAELPGVPALDKNQVYYLCVAKPKRAKAEIDR